METIHEKTCKHSQDKPPSCFNSGAGGGIRTLSKWRYHPRFPYFFVHLLSYSFWRFYGEKNVKDKPIQFF